VIESGVKTNRVPGLARLSVALAAEPRPRGPGWYFCRRLHHGRLTDGRSAEGLAVKGDGAMGC
jgi:hypothetical protein